MKITREWLEERIADTRKTLDELRNKSASPLNNNAIEYTYGQLSVYLEVYTRMSKSYKSCKIFPISVPQWKRNVIRFLSHICDRLEGVDDKNLFKRDPLEIKSDDARKNH